MKQQRTVRSPAARSSHIVVRGRGPLRRFGHALSDAVPAALRRWFAGPRNVLRVSARASRVERRANRWRPTDVIAAPDLVLERRLTLPAAARSDLKPAIELLIKSQTPFQPADLVIGVEAQAGAAEGATAYNVLLLPRANLAKAMRQHGLRRTGTVTIDAAPGQRPLDLAPAFDPRQRWRALIWLLPAVLALAAGWASLVVEASRAAAVTADLSVRLDAELSALRATTGERDALAAASADADLVRRTIRAAVSVAGTLAAVRAALSDTTEIVKVEFRDGAFRLSTRSDNALGMTKALAESFADWSVTNDGAITRDPQTGWENAIVALSPKDAQ
jgi:general secretion pathway protein L